MDFGSIIGSLFGVAIPAITAIAKARQVSKIDVQWRVAAARWQLVFRKPKTRVKRELRGAIDDFSVCVEETKKRRGKGKGTFTRFQVHHPFLGSGFELRCRQAPAGTLPREDEASIPTGDDEFDRRLLLTTESPGEAVGFFTAGRRAAALETLLRYQNGVVRNGEIEVRSRLAVETSGQIDEIIVSLLLLARSFTTEEDPPSRPELILPEIERYEPEPDPETAAEVEPEGEPEDEREPPPAPAPSLPAEEVGAALFKTSRMGSETERIFNQRFLDRRAHGTGTLVRIDSGGRLPGVNPDAARLVVLEFVDSDASDLGRPPVRFLIPVSKELAAKLQMCRGREIAFEGRLAGCNPYLREIHLEGNVQTPG